MLKKTLARAGFYGHGAFFIMVSPFTSSSNAQLSSYPTHQPDSYYATPVADTTVLTDSASLPAPDTVVLYAPCIEVNATAKKYSRQFIKKNEEALQAAEKRSERYFKIIEPIFEKYGLPIELKYLAVVESQLKPSALSHAGARGPWQLMPSTARDFGLKVNSKQDERTHYYKSTVAAAKYIKGLYNEFGDWLLVLAAYNSGSGTVAKAIKRSGSKNFWKLQGFLPAETRGHVKRFIATHTYFQDENSLTMLTSSETKKYLKALEEFKLEQTLHEDANTIIAVR
jgi:membrane-bound lytic murein transglycosylase D